MKAKWYTLSKVPVLMILLGIFLGFVVLKFLTNISKLEPGTQGDWVIGIGLLLFALVELYRNYEENRRQEIRPHNELLVQEVFPNMMKVLELNGERAHSCWIELFKVDDEPIRVTNFFEISPEHEELLRTYAPNMLKDLERYNKFIVTVEDNLVAFVKNIIKKNKVFEKSDSQGIAPTKLIEHVLGLALNKSRYMEHVNRGGNMVIDDVKKVEQMKFDKVLDRDPNLERVRSTLGRIEENSKTLRKTIDDKRVEIISEYGIAPSKEQIFFPR